MGALAVRPCQPAPQQGPAQVSVGGLLTHAEWEDVGCDEHSRPCALIVKGVQRTCSACGITECPSVVCFYACYRHGCGQEALLLLSGASTLMMATADKGPSA